MGRYEEAEQLYLKALEIYARAYGKDSERYRATEKSLEGLRELKKE